MTGHAVRPRGLLHRRTQVVVVRPDTVPTRNIGSTQAKGWVTHRMHRPYYYDYLSKKILGETTTSDRLCGGER